MEKVSFWIPLIPPSVNSIYKIHYAKRQVFLSNDARAFKNQAKMFVPSVSVEKDELFSMTIEIAMDWKFKNGEWKKMDLQNLIKLIIDCISEKWGICDSRIFNFCCKKTHRDGDEGIMVHMANKGLMPQALVWDF